MTISWLLSPHSLPETRGFLVYWRNSGAVPPLQTEIAVCGEGWPALGSAGSLSSQVNCLNVTALSRLSRLSRQGGAGVGLHWARCSGCGRLDT